MRKGLMLGFIYAGTVIGAGFASGAELYRFFGIYGSGGYIGLGASCILYALLGYFVFYIIGVSKVESVFELFGKGIFSRFITVLNFCFMFVLFCSMTAAAGAMGEMLFGINKDICGLLFCVFIFLCVFQGKNDFARLNTILTPLLLIFGIIVGIRILPPGKIKFSAALSEDIKAVYSAVIYVSYNILSLAAVIFPFKFYLKCDKIRIIASICGSMIMFAFGVCILPGIVVYCKLTEGRALPMLYLAGRFGGGIYCCLYSVVLFAAIFTTAAGSFFGLKEELFKGKAGMILLLASGYIGSLLGFSDIISEIYPFFGILGLFNIAIIVYNFIRTIFQNKESS